MHLLSSHPSDGCCLLFEGASSDMIHVCLKLQGPFLCFAACFIPGFSSCYTKKTSLNYIDPCEFTCKCLSNFLTDRLPLFAATAFHFSGSAFPSCPAFYVCQLPDTRSSHRTRSNLRKQSKYES